MKKSKPKTKWYALVAVALIVGAIIGYLATINLSSTGKSGAPLGTSGTISDCCSGSASNGYTYASGISEGCCMVVNLGYPGQNPIDDSCTIEKYNQASCDTEFKSIVDSLN